MNRERPKPGGRGDRFLLIERPKPRGAIDFCCGGDPSISKERQIGGGFLFLLVNPWGGMGAGELGDWDREERELGGE